MVGFHGIPRPQTRPYVSAVLDPCRRDVDSCFALTFSTENELLYPQLGIQSLRLFIFEKCLDFGRQLTLHGYILVHNVQQGTCPPDTIALASLALMVWTRHVPSCEKTQRRTLHVSLHACPVPFDES